MLVLTPDPDPAPNRTYNFDSDTFFGVKCILQQESTPAFLLRYHFWSKGLKYEKVFLFNKTFDEKNQRQMLVFGYRKKFVSMATQLP